MSVITTRLDGDVLIVTSNNPPVNALGLAVRKGLWEALDEAAASSAVEAVVILCEGRTFFAGADITEFDKPFTEFLLAPLIDKIEASEKPVVAAIHGSALGGGCEVALGCHYRIAVPSATLGLPEVQLGLLPGAGGTQRLPRLVGVEAALELIVGGQPVSAARAMALGLIDRLAAEGALFEDAVALARTVARSRPLPRVSERKASGEPSTFDSFRKANAKKFRGFEAPEANISCIEAATRLPFDQGMNFEACEFNKLLPGAQSAAQRHIFFAQRQAAKVDGVPSGTKRRFIGKVGIIGAGTMGGGIAMNFLTAGFPVTMVEMKAEALERGVETIRKNYDATVTKGRMTSEAVDRAMALLTPTLAFEALADCDLIIEAVFEDMIVKKEVFVRLDTIAKDGAILATNTSYLDVNEIAAVTARPADVLGMHFFSPANIMKLLEVVRGEKTADDVLATVMSLAKTIGKIAVVAGVCFGFIGNRMLRQRQNEAMKLLLEGATPTQVDKVHVDFGMPMGPFQMMDLAGVDIGWHRDRTRIDTIREALAAEGRWGQKTKAGFYDYDERRSPSDSARVAEIIADFREKAGVTPRVIGDEEIAVRTLYTMINEAALILEEGIAQRASDIDVVWVFGYGWPAYLGGPMYWAEREGCQAIIDAIETYRYRLDPSFRFAGSLKEKHHNVARSAG